MPDKSGAAANEGTAAHELAAWALTMRRDPADMLGRIIDIRGEDHHRKFLVQGSPLEGTTRWPVTPEMVEAVGLYVNYVETLGGERSIEQKMHMEAIHPEVWGTGDALVYQADRKALHIVDLKYGRGVEVGAENNPQLLAYASGALARMSNVGPVETITATIVQPRVDPEPKSWTLTLDELRAAESELGDAANLALAAAEAFVSDPQSAAMISSMGRWAETYLRPGAHCRFCKVAATCSARASDALKGVGATSTFVAKDPALLTGEELADRLRAARQIQHWVKSVEEYAHAEAVAGRVPPGFKLVAKRATRNWTDEESFIAAAPMILSISPAEMFGPQPLLSPAQLEKKLPKAERDALAAFVTTASSGTNLVAIDDARPSAKASAEDEFTSTL